ncbi:ATP-binding cassette domain-containing protein [Sporosarcina gallistercoris]|uniref:ABC transporter ATP-binding protein n=1 Tax=Sporosarcina gallistercoris TaxID=2762245 RepID=A0ABR8PL62_9BACL|nr:ABC transporter ATP-binding protein [Sporosarcina gallistercoris]MBD7908814.1 ABC transporter ATP-binding protein [Sporosarcina gallistercoris]
MLKLTNLSIAYQNKVVLDHLNLNAEKGEIIGVAAPNGTGKTTLFNIIANYTKPDSGQVVFGGKYTYRNEKEEVLIHKHLTTFPEQKDLFDELSGTDHLKLYASMWNGTSKHVPAVIDKLQMRHYVKKKAKTYSLGMRQRLCFAMMMAADTTVMLMDEVMNGLDVTNVALISECLLDMKQEGKLVFVASHLLENLDLYADRVIFLKEGKIVHEQRFTEDREIYLKAEMNSSDYHELKTKIELPAAHMYIAEHLLCIPMGGLTLSEQTRWIERILSLYGHNLTVGPLGTVEYYEKYFS